MHATYSAIHGYVFCKQKLHFYTCFFKNAHIPCKGTELISSDFCRRLLPISITLQFISLQTGGTAEIKKKKLALNVNEAG